MSKLLEAYRIALTENLTARQASIRFNVKMYSIAKCKNRYSLPKLRSHWDFLIEEQMDKMTNSQLIKYGEVLSLDKNSPKYRNGSFRCVREHRVYDILMKKRKLK